MKAHLPVKLSPCSKCRGKISGSFHKIFSYITEKEYITLDKADQKPDGFPPFLTKQKIHYETNKGLLGGFLSNCIFFPLPIKYIHLAA